VVFIIKEAYSVLLKIVSMRVKLAMGVTIIFRIIPSIIVVTIVTGFN
jgi:hypothetical protein